MFVVELTRHAGGTALGHQEAPRHAEMHHQHLAGGKIGKEILGSSAQSLDLLAFQALGEPFGKGKTQIGPALGHLGEAGADHGGLQAAAHGFDFGQFGHQPSLGFLRPLT
jgi:hypothetical protein